MEWMVVTQTLEDELHLENSKRDIDRCCEVESLQDLCNAMTEQNWYLRKMLRQSISHIAQLESEELS